MTDAPTSAAAARVPPTPWLRRGIAAVAALTLLEVLWELWLAPARPGGTWLALKALPLALLWPGLSRGIRRAGQWLTLLLPLYVTEALVRALTDGGRQRIVAITVLIVALVAWGSLLAALKTRRRPAS